MQIPSYVKELIDFSVETSVILLKSDSFTPTAISLNNDNKYVIGSGEGPDANIDIQLLMNDLKEKASAESIQACSLFFDIRAKDQETNEEIDAIQMIVEGREISPFQLIFTYRADDKGEYEISTPQFNELNPAIFV